MARSFCTSSTRTRPTRRSATGERRAITFKFHVHPHLRGGVVRRKVARGSSGGGGAAPGYPIPAGGKSLADPKAALLFVLQHAPLVARHRSCRRERVVGSTNIDRALHPRHLSTCDDRLRHSASGDARRSSAAFAMICLRRRQRSSHSVISSKRRAGCKSSVISETKAVL